MEVGKHLSKTINEIKTAYNYAVEKQVAFEQEIKEIGKKIISEIENNPDEIGIVLFGRPYNSYASEANMGIPHKFASRGVTIIPADFLPLNDKEDLDTMCWASGQIILKGAEYIKQHPQLFGTYVTNFSCGPDSFIVSYFRDILEEKPSLTLELDSHTASVGIDTRIEAFLDIIERYRKVRDKIIKERKEFQATKVVFKNKKAAVIDSDGKTHSLFSKKIKMLIPSMGKIPSELFSASFRASGINSEPVAEPEVDTLRLSRTIVSGKECLPYQLNIGSLLKYIQSNHNEEEILLYFMPWDPGNCRLAQYSVSMQKVIEKKKIRNVAVYSPSAEDNYGDLGIKLLMRLWKSIIISDMLEEIRSAIRVLAIDCDKAMEIFETQYKSILKNLAGEDEVGIYRRLEIFAEQLSKVERRKSVDETPYIFLSGEIYVRKDAFSRKGLIEKLGDRGFIVTISPFHEWIMYLDALINKKYRNAYMSIGEKIPLKVQQVYKKISERKIKNIMAKSGFYKYHEIDMDSYFEHGIHLVNPYIRGEAFLGVGVGLKDILEHVCGYITIGPFGCMPNRFVEGILSREMDIEGKINAVKDESEKGRIRANFSDFSGLPFLAIETDGNVFPQIIEARLDAFCLQAERIDKRMKEIEKDALLV